MARIKTQTSTAFYAPTARRRYLTRRAAAVAEARALLSRKYPAEHDDYGRIEWHWSHEDRHLRTHKRLARLIARAS